MAVVYSILLREYHPTICLFVCLFAYSFFSGKQEWHCHLWHWKRTNHWSPIQDRTIICTQPDERPSDRKVTTLVSNSAIDMSFLSIVHTHYTPSSIWLCRTLPPHCVQARTNSVIIQNANSMSDHRTRSLLTLSLTFHTSTTRTTSFGAFTKVE